MMEDLWNAYHYARSYTFIIFIVIIVKYNVIISFFQLKTRFTDV